MSDEVKQDAPEIMWIPAQRALTMLWKGNPKRHSIGDIISSLQKYGVQELPVFDATLNAIKAGNGRVECLAMMEREGMERPRGVLLQKDTGAWLLPVLGGVDAVSVDEARAYAVDSNNLTMAGGDFTDIDMMRMWDEDAYKSLLGELAEADTFTVTANEDILDELLSDYRGGDYGEGGSSAKDPSDVEFKEYDESVENDVVMLECPSCKHKFPA